jgi:hypothetical protein
MKRKKYNHGKDVFGVWEIRIFIEPNDPTMVMCEQERFNNFSYACRYAYALQHRKIYPWYKVIVVYNPPSEEYKNYIMNSCHAPKKYWK